MMRNQLNCCLCVVVFILKGDEKMVTLLDCIQRVPSLLTNILDNQEGKFDEINELIDDAGINSIVIVGSGTSYTASITAMPFIEKVTHLNTTVILPNIFLEKSSIPNNSLYLFVSQTGTSHLTQKCVEKIKRMGIRTVALTESKNTSLAKKADIHLCLDCGYEEYGCRTIGYSATIFNEMLMAIAIAKHLNVSNDYERLEEEARETINSIPAIIDKTIEWFNINDHYFDDIESYVIYGASSLWGVALEAALKIMEIPRKFLCIGYEMDDGLHGPTLALQKKHGIVILNDGEKSIEIADGLAKFIKNEIGYAFVIGKRTIDNTDLPLDIKGKDFCCLEYASCVQTFAYLLAQKNGVEIEPLSQMKLPDSKYYNTHD